jgi:carboxypeptidase family protein/TonB-dependent receptor-like protein
MAGLLSPPVRPAALPAAFAALLLALDAPPARTQDGATLAVTVAARGGEPLGAARVSVEGTGISGITNAAGGVRFVSLPAGMRTVEVRMIGLATRRVAVQLKNGETRDLRVEMDVDPVALRAVEGTAENRTRGMRMLASAGFYERQVGSTGTFVTREQIERMRPRFLSDVLRRYASIKLQTNMFNRSRVGGRRQAGPASRCEPLFFINGVPAERFEPDDIRPEDVEGIEIYDGPADIPPAFNRQYTSCGAIVVWTRIN